MGVVSRTACEMTVKRRSQSRKLLRTRHRSKCVYQLGEWLIGAWRQLGRCLRQPAVPVVKVQQGRGGDGRCLEPTMRQDLQQPLPDQPLDGIADRCDAGSIIISDRLRIDTASQRIAAAQNPMLEGA